MVTALRLYSKPIGFGGIVATAGIKPPSLPIWSHGGPTVPGFGAPPSLPSVGQVAGSPDPGLAGTIETSVHAPSTGALAGKVGVTTPFESALHTLPFWS